MNAPYNPARLGLADVHVFDYSLVNTERGHHEPAIDAMLRDVLQDDYRADGDYRALATAGHRVPRKPVVQPIGAIWLPEKQPLLLDMMQELKWYGMGHGCFQLGNGPNTGRPTGSAIVARGKNDQNCAVVLDGVRNAKFLGVSVINLPENVDRPSTCNEHVFGIWKSDPAHRTTACHDVEFDIELGGYWTRAALRLGHPVHTGQQEDHLHGIVRVEGMYDPHAPDRTDYWLRSVYAGNYGWGNNRRQRLAWLKSFRVRTPIWVEKTSLTVDRLDADGCRVVAQVAGAVGKITINGGECEGAQFLFDDQQGWAHDHGITFRNFYAKLNAWRPGLGRAGAWPDQVHPSVNEIGNWASGGGVVLDDVSIGFLPVRRDPDGRLVCVENVREEKGREVYDFTNIPAPRLRISGRGNHINSDHRFRMYGYRVSPRSCEGVECSDGATGRLRGWCDTLPDGRSEGPWEREDIVLGSPAP